MIDKFVIKQYLLDNKLANEKGNLLFSKELPANPTWGLGPYSEGEAMIYLVTLIHWFESKGALDNLEITLADKSDNYFTIYINEKDRNDDSANFDWNIATDTIEFLLPHMAGSNISYLSGNLFYYE